MRCSSCGALYKRRSTECFECGAVEINESVPASEKPQPNRTAIIPEKAPPKPRQKVRSKPSSSLIEFPSLNKSSIPQWRKELGERVREVQERRTREAAVEPGNAVRDSDETPTKTTGPLELLPQAEVPPINPLVAAALRRIERAHVSSQFGNNAVAMAVAFEEQPEFGEDMSHMANEANPAAISQPEQSAQSERLHKLAVVPPSAGGIGDTSGVIRKPKRLIAGDLNDPALNYLDSIPTPKVEKRGYRSAAIPYRMLSAIVDLIVICLLSSPLVALVKLTELNWQDLRVLTFAVGMAILVGFLFLTISIALTGRTLGMRLFSLRVVDNRTGLIPTGRQSAGRAAIYLLSLAFAGIALIYTFFDDQRNTAHDRFTRTAVIRA
jgi:uncharacterized RDD family membrane protein YckC